MTRIWLPVAILALLAPVATAGADDNEANLFAELQERYL